jgi:selenocysteine-specific elongation factor
VRAIQGHGAQLDAATPGSRAGVALAGIEVGDVARGATIVSDRDWQPTSRIRAEVELVPEMAADIRPRTWFRMHVGTAEVGARIVTREANTEGPFAARIVLSEPLLLRAGDRFVIRTSAPLNTIAGGVVSDPYPSRRARALPAGLDASQRLDHMLAEAGADGVELNALPVRLGLSPAECRALLGRADRRSMAVGTRLVSRAVLGQLSERLVAEVKAHHALYPLDPGIPAQLLRTRVKAPAEIVDGALDAASADERIVTRAGLVTLSGWSPTPDSRQTAVLETLVSQLEASGSEPPSIEELSAGLGADPGPELRYLERRGDVVQVEQNRYYAATQLKLILGRLRQAMAGGEELNPSQLRETLGLSRKYLIPLLEYCDRVGYTSRTAAGRVWRGV